MLKTLRLGALAIAAFTALATGAHATGGIPVAAKRANGSSLDVSPTASVDGAGVQNGIPANPSATAIYDNHGNQLDFTASTLTLQYGTAWSPTSGSITTAAAAQTLSAANASRRVLIVDNNSNYNTGLAATESLWVNCWGGTAAPNDGISLEIPANTTWTAPTPVPSGACSIYGATTGHKYAKREG